jgi:hypothetical protein
MVGITTVSPHAVDESAPCLHVRSASATSQRGCRRCSAQGFFEPLRTMSSCDTYVTSSGCNMELCGGAKARTKSRKSISARVAPVFSAYRL